MCLAQPVLLALLEAARKCFFVDSPKTAVLTNRLSESLCGAPCR